MRILHTFPPKLFVSPYLQWNGEKKAVIVNFLANFIHSPGSDIFLVYNEELKKDGDTFRTNNRAVLLKVAYLFSI